MQQTTGRHRRRRPTRTQRARARLAAVVAAVLESVFVPPSAKRTPNAPTTAPGRDTGVKPIHQSPNPTKHGREPRRIWTPSSPDEARRDLVRPYLSKRPPRRTTPNEFGELADAVRRYLRTSASEPATTH